MIELLEPEILDDWGDFSADLEGRIAWPYLDTDDPPVVTVGLGCALFTAEAFTALPWLRGDGLSAIARETLAAWDFLHTMRGGQVARAYAYPGHLHLEDAAIDALAQTRLRANAEQLARTFLDFPTWPTAAKRGALSIAWACGADFPRTWPLWSAAAKAQDWAGCAANCTIQKNPKRSEAQRQLFLAAVAA